MNILEKRDILNARYKRILMRGRKGNAGANMGFLGCASKEIAQHFGKYFGMLITEAKYGDIVDFEVIEEKYKI